MSPKEKKIVNQGEALSKSLATLANSLVECQGLDSWMIDQAEQLVHRMRENNDKHNRLVDKEDSK